MKIKDKQVTLTATAGKVRIKRMQGGFPRIDADEEIDLYYGLDYMQGHDRQMHMWLMKIIGRAKGSEFIKYLKYFNTFNLAATKFSHRFSGNR